MRRKRASGRARIAGSVATIAVAVLVVACSAWTTPSASTTPSGSHAAPSATAASETPAPSESSAPAPTEGNSPPASVTSSPIEGPVSVGPGDFILTNPGVGLEALTSYRATLTTSFAGADAEGPSEWTRTRVMTHAVEPGAKSVATEVSGDLPPADPSFE